MKKTIKVWGIAASIAAVLAACQKNEPAEPDMAMAEMNIVACSDPGTRTVLENDGKVIWNENGETLAVFESAGSTITYKESNEGVTEDGGQTMTFGIQFPQNTSATAFGYYALYPNSANVEKPSNLTKVKVALTSIQTPTATSFGQYADILVSKPIENLTEQPTELQMQFARIVAVGKMTISNLGSEENVVKVTFTAPEKVVTGRSYINLVTGEAVEYGYSNQGSDNVVLDYTDNGIAANGMTAYFTAWPFTIASEEKFTVTVETESKIFTKEVTVPAGKEIAFKEGKAAKFTVDFSGIEGNSKISDFKYAKLTFEEISNVAGNSWGSYNKEYSYTQENGAIWLIKCYYQSSSAFMQLGATDKNSYIKLPNFADNIRSINVNLKSAISGSKSLFLTNSATGTSGDIASLTTTTTATEYTFDVADKGIKTAYLRTTGTAQIVSIEVFAGEDTRTSLNTPENLMADLVSGTANSLEVVWDTVENAGSYVVTATPADGEPVSKEVTETSCTFEGLAYETAYTVSVYAKPSDANLYRDSEVAEVSVDTGEKPADMPNITIDVIGQTFTGKTTTSYSDFTDKVGLSGAIYAGNCAGGNKSVQLRSDKNSSGIVVTKSAGKATKIAVKWNSNTASGRILDVYGKSSAYTSASDLYNTSTQGTKIGSIVYGTSTELIIEGDYTYIGLRSNSGAMYLESISITWDTDGDSSDTPKELTSLSWTGYKDTYTVGSTFSVDGTIKAIYSDNSEKTLSAEDVQIETEPDLSKAGTTTAKISYTEGDITVSAEAAITVKEASQGGESNSYTLQFGADYNSKSVSSYTASWTVTCDNFTWDMTNWNNNNNGWNYVKCGSKSATSVATITTSASIPEAISKVIVTIDAVKADNVNSIKLLVASDKEFTENLQEIPVTEIQTGEISLNISTPTENCFYQLAFDCKKSSSNGIVQVSKIVYTNE
ncbi:MAG: fibronectin type III domain-containing protein [Clostridium sp.]|nr:fibronectin type III domain-containing protein [Bacteroides sp.]MCM1198018.1 fibronectin type III domain-containing protein [Clostridium sp.]